MTTQTQETMSARIAQQIAREESLFPFIATGEITRHKARYLAHNPHAFEDWLEQRREMQRGIY